MGLREDILSKDDLPREKVDIHEWGLSICVRTMTAKERDRFDQEQLRLNGPDKRQNLENFRARLAIQTVIDESGARIFEDKDLAALSGKSCLAIGRIFEVAARLNGMTAKDVEDLTKNSDPGQRDGSP